MNPLLKPTIQKNLISSAYIRYLRRKRLVESALKDSENPLFVTADKMQDSAQQELPRIKGRPLPPAKPPMRLR